MTRGVTVLAVTLAAAGCSGETVRLGGAPALDAALADEGSPGSDGGSPGLPDASDGEAASEAASGVVAIATGRSSPSWIVVDDTSVYWSEDGAAGTASSPNAVMKAAKDGTALTVLHADLGLPQGIALDDTYVYFIRALQPGVEIDRISKTGDPTTFAQVYTQSAGMLGGLAVDTSTAYFAVGSGILAVPKTATLGTATRVGPLFAHSWELALDGTLLYVGDMAGLVPLTAMDLLDGGTAWNAGTGVGFGVGFDTAYVFWTTGTHVLRSTKGGGTGATLAACATECDAVVADDTGMAWATLSEVTESALDGTQAKTLASGFTGIHHAAIDATSVYFTDSPGGGVWRANR